MSDCTRRDVLQLAAATALSQSVPESASGAPNSKGTLYTGSPIELYTNTLSVVPGEQVTVHVSTTAQRFNLEIARAGLEETVVWTKSNLHGRFHPTPADAWEKGCRWPASVKVSIPPNWKSGYYQIKAITTDPEGPRSKSLAFVVVRATQPTAKILFVLATSTHGAYNSYGGASIYIKKATGRGAGLMGWTGEHEVSFQRPWMPGFLHKSENYSFDAELQEAHVSVQDKLWINPKSGIPLWANFAGFHNWERVMVHWLERNGYAVDYAVSSDLEFHPEVLGRYRLLLSVGHDEYWSWGMRDTVESFIAQGGNCCFFSGNSVFWQVRFKDQGRGMVCYKSEFREDPYLKSGHQRRTATNWISHHVGRPETKLTGLSTFYGGYARFSGASPNGAGGYLIYRPDHWIFKDTGVTFGDCLGQKSNVVHFEVDGCPIRMENGLPFPAADYDGPASLDILGMHPAGWPFPKPELETWARDVLGDVNPEMIEKAAARGNHAIMGIYTNHGTVFSAGTTDWTSGLTGKDPVVEKVTKNLLDRLSA